MARVRTNPSDPRARVGLARIFALTGQWDRVATQLQTAAQLDPSGVMYTQAYTGCARCERLRADVFAGKRTPLIVGEPPEWVALLVQALQAADGVSRAPLIEQALDQAPAIPGQLDGEPFDWIADGDARLGPVIEAFVDAKYYWIPFERIDRIAFDAPADLIDTVWLSCEIVLATGASQKGYVPVRYPGSESAADSALVLGRSTQWTELVEPHMIGLGQRMFITNHTERALLDCRELRLQRPS